MDVLATPRPCNKRSRIAPSATAVGGDLGELDRVEARPPDERPVHVWLGHQLGDGRRLDRPAVLDADGPGHLGPVIGSERTPYRVTYFLRILGRGRAAGPDG